MRESVAWLERFLHDYEGTRRRRHPRPLLPRQRGRLDPGAGPAARGIPLGRQLLLLAGAKDARLAQEASSETPVGKSIEKELEWVRQNPRPSGQVQGPYGSLSRSSTPTTTRSAAGQRTVHSAGPRLGDKVVEVANLCKSHGDRQLIDDLSSLHSEGPIVGIIGPNGAGKIYPVPHDVGPGQPDSGHHHPGRYRRALASVDQFRDSMNDKEDGVQKGRRRSGHPCASAATSSRAVPIGRFSFKGRSAEAGRRALQRGRLPSKAKLLQTGGVLLLDEPTNVWTSEPARPPSNALLEFPGCAMVISTIAGSSTVSPPILDYQDEGKIAFFEGNFTRNTKSGRRPTAPTLSSRTAPKVQAHRQVSGYAIHELEQAAQPHSSR